MHILGFSPPTRKEYLTMSSGMRRPHHQQPPSRPGAPASILEDGLYWLLSSSEFQRRAGEDKHLVLLGAHHFFSPWGSSFLREHLTSASANAPAMLPPQRLGFPSGNCFTPPSLLKCPSSVMVVPSLQHVENAPPPPLSSSGLPVGDCHVHGFSRPLFSGRLRQLSSVFSFHSLIMMCLGTDFFELILHGVHSPS